MILLTDTYFFREQYTFILQTSRACFHLPSIKCILSFYNHQVTSLTGVFYQMIFQNIMKGNFVLNKGNWKGTVLGLGKVWKNLFYVCVCVVFLTLCMSIFEDFLLGDISLSLLTKHQVIKAECAQTKSWNGAIRYCWILP